MLYKTFFVTAMLVLIMAVAVAAKGKEGKISGVISGAHCGAMGMVCSPDHDLRRAELPGIYTKDNKFYFLTNVPQLFLAQWPIKEVTVEGTIYEQGNGVIAKKIMLQEGDKWRTVFQDGYIVDDMGHKDKLSNAVEVDGKWYCGKYETMHKHGMMKKSDMMKMK